MDTKFTMERRSPFDVSERVIEIQIEMIRRDCEKRNISPIPNLLNLFFELAIYEKNSRYLYYAHVLVYDLTVQKQLNPDKPIEVPGNTKLFIRVDYHVLKNGGCEKWFRNLSDDKRVECFRILLEPSFSEEDAKNWFTENVLCKGNKN